MDDQMRKAMSAIVDALELYWLESKAAMHLLRKNKHLIPSWYDFIYNYAHSEEGRSEAAKKFELPRLLIRQAQIESKDLEELLKLLQGLTKDEEPN